MGPQSFDCGKRPESPPWGKADWLQWGRSLSTAERSEFRRELIAEMSLQWGRSLSTAESRCQRPASRRPSSFNGAAVFRLRKESVKEVWSRICMASMGPQSFDCGKDRGGDLEEAVGDASMGPQSFDCGKSFKPHSLKTI